MPNLDRLRQMGFDRSEHVRFTTRYKVRCSQCEALVINGHPCHETGCPNARTECKGCSNLVHPAQRYCDDCW